MAACRNNKTVWFLVTIPLSIPVHALEVHHMRCIQVSDSFLTRNTPVVYILYILNISVPSSNKILQYVVEIQVHRRWSSTNCCCCCCCLHIKSRSDLYSVLSNIRTGPTDANAFRGHRLTTQKGYTYQKEIKGPRKVNTHAIIGK